MRSEEDEEMDGCDLLKSAKFIEINVVKIYYTQDNKHDSLSTSLLLWRRIMHNFLIIQRYAQIQSYLQLSIFTKLGNE